MPYCRKRASRHSCAPSSVPLTMDGCTVSQAPVFVSRCSQRACKTVPPSSAAISAFSACRYPLRRTAVRPSWRQVEWSAVRNSNWPLSAATRCPVITQDAVQFSGAVWEGSGSANPACLNGRRVTPRSGTPLPSPSNNAGTKVSFRAVSPGQKASMIPGVTHCKNDHSCWSDFCSSA